MGLNERLRLNECETQIKELKEWLCKILIQLDEHKSKLKEVEKWKKENNI